MKKQEKFFEFYFFYKLNNNIINQKKDIKNSAKILNHRI